MIGHDPGSSTAANFARFAGEEAAERSPAYAELADAVAVDQELLEFLSCLPLAKRQPNLLFAAACYLLGSPPDHDRLRRLVRKRGDELAALMCSRRTQTNEAARCALLLPVLAALPQPLALLEVGAAAGLTLLPDCHSYRYACEGGGWHEVAGADPEAPTITCAARGPVPLPAAVPVVAWRAGLDLSPLGLDDARDTAWLRCLIWPGQPARSDLLSSAIDTARRHRPEVVQGDLLDDLPALAGRAPEAATLVVYHAAVLAYVDESRRRAFAAAVRSRGATWLSCEAPAVLEASSALGRSGGLALVQDGERLLARADSHGAWLEWLA